MSLPSKPCELNAHHILYVLCPWLSTYVTPIGKACRVNLEVFVKLQKFAAGHLSMRVCECVRLKFHKLTCASIDLYVYPFQSTVYYTCCLASGL